MKDLINILYLVSIAFFILGLKMLSSPRTARKGNLFSMIGMFIAVVVTLFDKQILDYTYIIAGILIGSVIGLVMARRVQMTAMPQMVALLNAFGGIASGLVVLAQFYHDPMVELAGMRLTMALSIFIGVVTFSGSMIAFAKLQELIGGAPVVFKGQLLLNAIFTLIAVALIGLFAISMDFSTARVLLILFVLSLVLGISMIIPIGGADMPVVISLLNSLSGLAAALTGFVVYNSVLIVSGALVGASGLILTNLMCKAMNRSLWNVLFGAVGSGTTVAQGDKKNVTRYTPTDAAIMLDRSSKIIIIPGYGLAVAQAQYALHEVVEFLRKRGAEVYYAIHPVAGRMPGHMNVLLAEANVPYELLKDLDEINPEFPSTETVLIVGANDVTNPLAREKGNPLSGMPILNVDQAQNIIIIKRSLSPGFAGVDNPLFYDPKTMMVFGDAKEVLMEISAYFKES